MLVAALTAACASPSSATDEPRRLYTLFDIQAALHEGRMLPAGPAFPTGIAPDSILTRGDPADTLKIAPAFSEGAPAAYVVTDLWLNFPEVWVQPWYILVTDWNEKSPRQNQLKDAQGKNTPPLIDVGPDSGFYSAFWRHIYAVVPPGTPPDKYVSSRQLFDDGIPLHFAAPWFYTVRPATVGLVPAKPLHPILQVEVGNISLGEAALIEGATVPYFNVGGTNFRFDDALVVEETPLFIFVRRDAAGVPIRLGAPDVVGSGPLYARRPADVANGQPRFGAFTRFYLAYLPATAAAFDLAAYPLASQRLQALVPPIDPRAYQGRVALNGSKVAATDVDCFADEMFPDTCRWLDSQQRIEEGLARQDIERTGVTAATPLVFYGGKAVGAR